MELEILVSADPRAVLPRGPLAGAGPQRHSPREPVPRMEPCPRRTRRLAHAEAQVASALAGAVLDQPSQQLPSERRAAIPDPRGALSRSAHSFQNPPRVAAARGLKLVGALLPFPLRAQPQSHLGSYGTFVCAGGVTHTPGQAGTGQEPPAGQESRWYVHRRREFMLWALQESPVRTAPLRVTRPPRVCP